jgi:hypothetical protein
MRQSGALASNFTLLRNLLAGGFLNSAGLGFAAYIALVLHSILTRRVSLLVFLPCFAAAYMVSARTVMGGMVIFYLGYLACTNVSLLTSRMRQFASVRTLGIALVGLPITLLVASFFFDSNRLIEKIEMNLAIFDPDRGVSSGFTGRTESWSIFFDAMDQFVFFGYGFRSSRYGLHGVHSGVLSYFMDFGLILGGVLLIAIIARAAYLVWYGVHRNEQRGLIAGLTIGSTLVIQCFEPDNFNIGFIGAFFFMLILAYVEPVRLRRVRVAATERPPLAADMPGTSVQLRTES